MSISLRPTAALLALLFSPLVAAETAPTNSPESVPQQALDLALPELDVNTTAAEVNDDFVGPQLPVDEAFVGPLPREAHEAPTSSALYGVPVRHGRSPISFGVSANTLGVGMQVGWRINHKWGLRASINRGSLSRTQTIDGIEYDGEVEAGGIRLLADWHPFSGGFRLTGGLAKNTSEISAVAQLDGDTRIGNTVISPEDIGSLHGRLDFDQGVAPYVGLGWGQQTRQKKGLSMSLDLGVILQDSPKITVTEQGSTFISEEDIRLETAEAQKDIDDEFSMYPVLNLGMHYTF